MARACTADATTVGRRRWGITALLAAGVLVNYFDRVVLTVAVPTLQHDLVIDDLKMGLLLGAFGWTYGALQIPIGLLLDRFGVRRVMSFSIILWSAASIVTSAAIGYGALFIGRLLLGVAEAPTFPANAKAVGYWFPRHERSLATAMFDAAAKFSNVIAIPIVAFAVLIVGWRGAFICTGILSLVYFAVFRAIYAEPAGDRRLTAKERTYIQSGGSAPEGVSSEGNGSLLLYLLTRRKVICLSLGFACYGYAFAFFIFWLPGYLTREMKMDIMSSAAFSAIPWSFATLADLAVGGWLIDHLIRQGHSETVVRKAIMVLGMVIGLAVFGAGITHDRNWAIFWITLSLSGLAMTAPASWSLPSLIAPRGAAGTVGGIMNFANSVAGVASPAITGLIVATYGSFSLAFLLTAAVLAVGVAAFTVGMGAIAPIPEPSPKKSREKVLI